MDDLLVRIRTASVLVPPTSMPIRFIRSGSCLGGREYGTEIEVVAEGAGTDEFEAARLVSTSGAGSATTVTRWP